MEPVKVEISLSFLQMLRRYLMRLTMFENTHMSNASYAIRYAAGNENVAVVLSGMSNMEQMRDNVYCRWNILRQVACIACGGCEHVWVS